MTRTRGAIVLRGHICSLASASISLAKGCSCGGKVERRKCARRGGGLTELGLSVAEPVLGQSDHSGVELE
jgi:hypothetical protein